MGAAFVIGQDTLSPLLTRLAGKLSPQSVLGFVTSWGVAVRSKAKLNAKAKGGKHMWRDIARATELRTISKDGVEVYCSHVAAAQKQFGGTIEAPGKGAGSKGAKYLAIPISPESKGVPVGEFVTGGIKLFVLGKKDGERGGVLGYSEDGVFHGLYALRKRVRQKADPWFPGPKEIVDIGDRMAEKKLNA